MNLDTWSEGHDTEYGSQSKVRMTGLILLISLGSKPFGT